MSTRIMMKCGHMANGIDKNSKPICTICKGINPGAIEPEKIPNLKHRKAICIDCGRKVKSSLNLPFFKYRGPGNTYSKFTLCKNCGTWLYRHIPGYKVCDNFEVSNYSLTKYDLYHCGCKDYNGR